MGSHIHATPKIPSNKKFGAFFSAIFAVFTVYFLWKNSAAFALSFGVTATFFGFLALFFSSALAPINRAWFQLGLLLGKLVSPIILGAIFFIVITPTALISRLFGRDVLFLKRCQLSSYWIERSDNDPQSFLNQF